ncbi:MAG: MBOAT family O-acyltransferase [Planctomycetota bacterium]|jgi:alginate O-acetyltransferase complex protein AlgI
MVFSSLLFLVAFLPVFLALYYATPIRFRNHVALAGSYLFYAWGAPRFVIVLLASSAIDYWLSRQIDRAPKESTRRRRLLLGISLVLNLGLLAFFKYANFFVEEFSNLLLQFGGESIFWRQIALPIGISFFTFQKITYIVDVYRRVVPPARSLAAYALYVAMFPQLIAGPIVRYHDIADQLSGRVHSVEKIFSGIWRFCLGLGKKVLVANSLAVVADRTFAADAATLPTTAAWLGILCFTFQIYFDFSGYSDMAIGLARMMGFELPENFNCPHVSGSFTEFWRRWHISLSNFMREYLYIPLGGNRVRPYRMYLNLWIVFLLSGLWHGANWTFVAWGAYHGLFLSLEKLFSGWTARGLPRRLPRLAAVPLTFLLITVGWVFFRCALSEEKQTIADAGTYLSRLADVPSVLGDHGEVAWLLGEDGGLASRFRTLGSGIWRPLMSNRETVVLVSAALISFLPAWPVVDRLVQQREWRQDEAVVLWTKFATAMSLLVLSVCSLANLHFNPFLYFRF